MKRQSVSAFLILLATCAVAACSGADAGDGETGDDAEIVATVLANTAKVYPDRLVFPKKSFTKDLRGRVDRYAAAINAGKTKADVENVILTGKRQEGATDKSGAVKEDVGNPLGYIRRALSYKDSGEETTVMTEKASLDEAFKEFQANGSVAIGPASDTDAIHPDFGKNAKLHYVIPVINVDGKELFRKGESVIRIKSGYVRIDANIDLGVDIGFRGLNEAHTIIDANVQSELVLEAASSASFTKSIQKDVFKAKWPIGSIGPVPVTLGITATVGCDFTANGRISVSGGEHVDVLLHGGVTYEKNDGVKPVFNRPRFEPSLVKPVVEASADGSARCYMKPQIELFLYDVIGPTLTPELWGKLSASVPPLRANLTGGVSVKVGGELKIFGKQLGAIDKELFSMEKQLWSMGPP